MQTTTTATQTCTKPLTAIMLPCPFCGAEEASISIALHNLEDDDAQFTCHDCNAEFGRNAIHDIIKRWTRILTWLESAPDMGA